MAESNKKATTPAEEEFDKVYNEISKVLLNRCEDITKAYIESGKGVEWYVHFIRCLESIKKGPPAEDAEEAGSGSRSRKRHRADSQSDSPTRFITTKGPATCKVIGPATIHIKTEGNVSFRFGAATTIRVDEARMVWLEPVDGMSVNTTKVPQVKKEEE